MRSKASEAHCSVTSRSVHSSVLSHSLPGPSLPFWCVVAFGLYLPFIYKDGGRGPATSHLLVGRTTSDRTASTRGTLPTLAVPDRPGQQTSHRLPLPADGFSFHSSVYRDCQA